MQSTEDSQVIRMPRLLFGITIIFLFSFVYLVATHFGEIENFGKLLSHAKPEWLILAVCFQVGTYFCAGAVWKLIADAAGHKISGSELARLSIEKLTVDQLLPTGGVTGNVVIYKAMKNMGISDSVALEAIIMDIFSHYITAAFMTGSALTILWFYHGIPEIVRIVASGFAVIMIVIPFAILWVLRNPDRELPKWMKKIKPAVQAHEVVRSVSTERLYSPKLIAYSVIFTFGIYVLDTLTLWAMLEVTGYPLPIVPTFAALVIAYISGVVTLLPGGIAGFEAGCVFVLTLFGVPIEAALTGTLLLRGFTLWLPLIPGLILAQRDVQISF